MGLITGPLRRRALRHFEGLTLERSDDANSLGVQSLGKAQVRGNGTLALTTDELLFAQWVPNRVFHIPRSAIIEVTTTRAFLGKTIGRELLLVRWDDDAIALRVADLSGWIDALAGSSA